MTFGECRQKAVEQMRPRDRLEVAFRGRQGPDPNRTSRRVSAFGVRLIIHYRGTGICFENMRITYPFMLGALSNKSEAIRSITPRWPTNCDCLAVLGVPFASASLSNAASLIWHGTISPSFIIVNANAIRSSSYPKIWPRVSGIEILIPMGTQNGLYCRFCRESRPRASMSGYLIEIYEAPMQCEKPSGTNRTNWTGLTISSQLQACIVGRPIYDHEL